MGNVCKKNETGMVAFDAPQQLQKKPQDRELVSQQQVLNGAKAAQTETKFVRSWVNFNDEIKKEGDQEKTANEVATEFANKWCEENEGWNYTGVWKNEAQTEGGELSYFEVAKRMQIISST